MSNVDKLLAARQQAAASKLSKNQKSMDSNPDEFDLSNPDKIAQDKKKKGSQVEGVTKGLGAIIGAIVGAYAGGDVATGAQIGAKAGESAGGVLTAESGEERMKSLFGGGMNLSDMIGNMPSYDQKNLSNAQKNKKNLG